MYLTAREKEFLFVAVAAKLAKERKEKGLKLNYPEAIAYITFQIMEYAREGNRTKGRSTRSIKIVNRGDRTIFVGSHYHFY